MGTGFYARPAVDNGVYVGFNCGYGGRHIKVSHTHDGVLEIMSTGDNLLKEINPYAFYKMFETILGNLAIMFDPKHSVFSKAPKPIQQKWFREKVHRYWCKAIHNQWLRLIRSMDPKRLDIARAMFAANFSNGQYSGIDILKSYHKLNNGAREEIINFTAAAMVADQRPDYFMHVEFLANSGFSGLLGRSPTNAKEKDECDSQTAHMDMDAFEDEMFITLSEDEDRQDKTAADWRSHFVYSDSKTISKELSQTLEAVKPGYAFSVLSQLGTIEIERPLLSKQELTVNVAAQGKQSEESFQVSSKKNIIEAMHAYRNLNGDKKISCRKTQDMLNAVDDVQFAPGFRGTQDMLKLTERTVSKKHGNWKPPLIADDDLENIFGF